MICWSGFVVKTEFFSEKANMQKKQKQKKQQKKHLIIQLKKKLCKFYLIFWDPTVPNKM